MLLPVCPFQFHKGTIRTLNQTLLRDFQSHFNSIKVQLELIAGAGSMLGGLLFQFHKGTIRTRCFNLHLPDLTNFNSIKVQLELATLYLVVNLVNHFNSIKVQLEPTTPIRCWLSTQNFNSIKVQLELWFQLLLFYFLPISIP